ncbi:unnamed protein product [Cylicocyclus nassatus]|uniref:Uncharacterized protein n=1 Tax=Cylicocyclus nassatus TaxID=53992 RepID=A0AA36H036_CYLNA|nr:unnamed protein product [Cylicocyclus nassatus]
MVVRYRVSWKPDYIKVFRPANLNRQLVYCFLITLLAAPNVAKNCHVGSFPESWQELFEKQFHNFCGLPPNVTLKYHCQQEADAHRYVQMGERADFLGENVYAGLVSYYKKIKNVGIVISQQLMNNWNKKDKLCYKIMYGLKDFGCSFDILYLKRQAIGYMGAAWFFACSFDTLQNVETVFLNRTIKLQK